MKELINTLNTDQRVIFDKMNESDSLQVCLPTGVGKGYLMGVDIKNRMVDVSANVITIASHRLILNTQHMDDLVDRLSDIIENVRFIFVGSSKYDHSKLLENKKVFKKLHENKLSSNEIMLHSLSKTDLTNKVQSLTNDGKKVVIISTYHSLDKLSGLDIDVFYGDEAHTLASNENLTRFEQNFKSIKFKKSYFFTATPKDCVEDTDDSENFLMNNESVFGERVGMSMSDAIKLGYITRPIIHSAVPKDYKNEDMNNLENKVKFILDTYKVHTELVKESSSFPELIEPKLLIKCESVDIMWDIYDRLLKSDDETLNGVRLFAGASRKGVNGAPSYEMDGKDLPKDTHMDEMKLLSNLDKAIVVHVDTLSEGVNIKGFTGVMFLTDKTPTIIKLLQNIGRGTRVLDEDRKRFNNGEINTNDYEGWIKPNTFVILPIYSPESEVSQRQLATTIKNVRDKSEISIHKVSIGDDKGKGRDNSMDSLVDVDSKDPRKKLIDAIDHNIEELYLIDKDFKESMKLTNMTDVEKWEHFILGK